MLSHLIGCPAAVQPNVKSHVHTSFGRVGGDMWQAFAAVPFASFFRGFFGTLKPSFRHSLHTRLRFTFRPSATSKACSRRKPKRGRASTSSRSRCRSAASSFRGGLAW